MFHRILAHIAILQIGDVFCHIHLGIQFVSPEHVERLALRIVIRAGQVDQRGIAGVDLLNRFPNDFNGIRKLKTLRAPSRRLRLHHPVLRAREHHC